MKTGMTTCRRPRPHRARRAACHRSGFSGHGRKQSPSARHRRRERAHGDAAPIHDAPRGDHGHRHEVSDSRDHVGHADEAGLEGADEGAPVAARPRRPQRRSHRSPPVRRRAPQRPSSRCRPVGGPLAHCSSAGAGGMENAKLATAGAASAIAATSSSTSRARRLRDASPGAQATSVAERLQELARPGAPESRSVRSHRRSGGSV